MIPNTPFPRSFAIGLLACLIGCASAAPPEDSGPGWRGRAAAIATGVGGAVVTGATAVGHGLGTAYEGVSEGFQEPQGDDGCGPYPEDYVRVIRKHFLRVEGLPAATRFEFGPPQKGYMNRGLLRGGGVAWQGYLVEVEVEVERVRTRLVTSRHYVVRVRDGDVIDVHADADSDILQRF